MLKTANWLNHLEFDWKSPVWNHWFDALSAHHRLYRYDIRGTGLSDRRNDTDISFATQVADLELIADSAGLDDSRCSAFRREPPSPSNMPRVIRSE